jgi:hypothetical protein
MHGKPRSVDFMWMDWCLLEIQGIVTTCLSIFLLIDFDSGRPCRPPRLK